MIRPALFVGGLLLAGLMLPSAWAHDEFRVIGTIAKHKGVQLEVKTRDGRVANIHTDKNTEITKDDAKIPASDLKVGRFVVINAYGDDYTDMLAMDIKIVPAPAP